MRQVTAIEPQKKTGSRRVNILLDGRFSFSLQEELAARLAPGCFLSEGEIGELRRQDGLRQLHDAALTLLSYRSRSVAELRARLLRRGFDAALVDEVLEQLNGQGILDDQDFARFWVENRQSFSPRGGRLLRAELRFKGVEREIIEGVLPSPEDEDEAAYRAGRKKARTLRALDWCEFRRRMGDHLVRRGFSYETAATAIRTLWAEMDSPPEDASETSLPPHRGSALCPQDVGGDGEPDQTICHEALHQVSDHLP